MWTFLYIGSVVSTDTRVVPHTGWCLHTSGSPPQNYDEEKPPPEHVIILLSRSVGHGRLGCALISINTMLSSLGKDLTLLAGKLWNSLLASVLGIECLNNIDVWFRGQLNQLVMALSNLSQMHSFCFCTEYCIYSALSISNSASHYIFVRPWNSYGMI